MVKLSIEQIQEVCQRYESGETTRELGKAFDVCHPTILRYLVKAGIPRRSRTPARKLTPKQENYVCIQYKAGKSTLQLAKELSVSFSLISRTLIRAQVPRRRKNTRYSVGNPHYFDIIDSEVKAYWLGFIAADGHIQSTKDILLITLARRDREHLMRLRSALDTDYPVRDYKYSTEISTIAIQESALVNGLVAQGLTQHKTFTLIWPNHISSDLLHHFIRGYVDGDGGFYATLNKYQKTPNIAFNVTSYEPFILSMQLHLMKKCNLSKTKLAYRRAGIKSPTLRYCGRLQVKRIFDYLYKDATVWLPRKRDKIEPYL